MCVSNGEWVGNLESEPLRETLSYKNFDVEIVCYEVENDNLDVIGAAKNDNLTAKI